MAHIHTMTDEELVKLTWLKEDATPLEVELAQRLETLLEEYEALEDLALNLSSGTQERVGA